MKISEHIKELLLSYGNDMQLVGTYQNSYYLAETHRINAIGKFDIVIEDVEKMELELIELRAIKEHLERSIVSANDNMKPNMHMRKDQVISYLKTILGKQNG